MDLGKQTAGVISSPIAQQSFVSSNELIDNNIGLLGVSNPESFNQRDLFYFSPQSIRIRIVDSDLNKLPSVLTNYSYPNSYEMIFYDRGADNKNPTRWVKLDTINGRALLGVEKNTPWKVTWDTDGTSGIQMAYIKHMTFYRETVQGNNGKASGFGNWQIKSVFPLGWTQYSYYTTNTSAPNYLGWMFNSYLRDNGGISSQKYPETVKCMVKMLSVASSTTYFSTAQNNTVINISRAINNGEILMVFVGMPVY